MHILMYHRVADDGPAALARWRVSPSAFGEQMAHLAQEGFRPRPLSKWSADAGPKDIVLTFDDAYLDFFDTALPVLKRHGFVATMFVPTGRVGGVAEWDAPFGAPAPLMSWEQLGAVADAGIELGAHTLTHPHLTALDPATARAEITGSRDELIRRFGRPVTTFAYPYGDHDAVTRRAVADAGMPLAVTTDKPPFDELALLRLEVSGGDSLADFARKLAGG